MQALRLTAKLLVYDLDVLLDREDFDFEEVEAYSAVQKALNNCEHDDEKACVDEYGISSFVFEERKPFNRDRFNKLVEEYPGDPAVPW